MDSRFLDSLIRVIETGSIAQTARQQHLTPAAVSQRMRALELEFGTPLLVRTKQCLTPTEACMRILSRARHIVHEVNGLVNDLQPEKFTCPFRLGVIPSQWAPNLAVELEGLRKNFPSMRISLSLNTSRNLYTNLLKGEIDAVIIEAPEFTLPRQLQNFTLSHEALVLISHDSIETDVKTILQTRPYIEYRPDPFITNFAERFLEDLGITLNPICDTGSLDTIRVLVANGAGVSLVPHWPQLFDSNLVVQDLATPYYSRTIALITTNTTTQLSVFPELLSTLRRNFTIAPQNIDLVS